MINTLITYYTVYSHIAATISTLALPPNGRHYENIITLQINDDINNNDTKATTKNNAKTIKTTNGDQHESSISAVDRDHKTVFEKPQNAYFK